MSIVRHRALRCAKSGGRQATRKVQQPATALKEKVDCNRFRRVEESRYVEPKVGEAGPEKGRRVPGSWLRRLDCVRIWGRRERQCSQSKRIVRVPAQQHRVHVPEGHVQEEEDGGRELRGHRVTSWKIIIRYGRGTCWCPVRTSLTRSAQCAPRASDPASQLFAKSAGRRRSSVLANSPILRWDGDGKQQQEQSLDCAKMTGTRHRACPVGQLLHRLGSTSLRDASLPPTIARLMPLRLQERPPP